MSDFSGDNGGFGVPPPPPNMAPPPGYVPYGGQTYGAFSAFRPVDGLGRWLTWLVIIQIPLQIISLLALLSIRHKARDFLDGDISEADYTSSASPLAIVGFLSGAITVAIVVLTMIWMFRMAKNQQTMQRMGTWSQGWAIGGWFCPPCVLYVVPYLMFKDLWKSSDPESGFDWRQNPVGGIVHVWWVLYGLVPIAFVTATFANLRVGQSVEDAAKAIDRTYTLTAIANVVQVGAAIAYVMLVRQLTARHKLVIHEG